MRNCKLRKWNFRSKYRRFNCDTSQTELFGCIKCYKCIFNYCFQTELFLERVLWSLYTRAAADVSLEGLSSHCQHPQSGIGLGTTPRHTIVWSRSCCLQTRQQVSGRNATELANRISFWTQLHFSLYTRAKTYPNIYTHAK